MRTTSRNGQVVTPQLVGWGAVFSGAVIGLGLAVLAGSLWVALAFGSHQAAFYNPLAWWLAGAAIGATLMAALIAGAVSGTRGPLAGLATGLTTWAVVVLFTLATGDPAL